MNETVKRVLAETCNIMAEVANVGSSAESRLLAAAIKTLADIVTLQQMRISELEKSNGKV